MKLTLLSVMMFAGVFGVAFAQVNDSQGLPYTKESALAVALGALVWALQHFMRVTIPSEREQNRDTQARQQELFAEIQTKQQEVFREGLARIVERQRAQHEERLEDAARCRDALSSLISRSQTSKQDKGTDP
jgi:hypothetical protein